MLNINEVFEILKSNSMFYDKKYRFGFCEKKVIITHNRNNPSFGLVEGIYTVKDFLSKWERYQFIPECK